jgi:hypothetical protein
VDLLFAGFSYSGPRRWNFSHPMKWNKRSQNVVEHFLANKPEFHRPISHNRIIESAQRSHMSDIGLQPREMRDRSNRLPAKGRPGRSETRARRDVASFTAHAGPLSIHATSLGIVDK